MGEEELEVLITVDDPGEDDLEEDTFHKAVNGAKDWPGQSHQGGDPTTKQK